MSPGGPYGNDPKEGKMISKLRGRVSSAHVIALAALFVAIGGTAFAAATIGTHDIQNGAVTAKKLHKKAVRAKKIKNQAVKTKKIGDEAVRRDKLADRAVGTDKLGDRAVTSVKLAAPAVATGNLVNRSVTALKLGDTEDGVATRTVQPNDTLIITVDCPSGDQAISGGYFTPPGGAVQVTRMRRLSDASWAFTFHNTSDAAHAVDARVTCLVG
jgi:hypothetical protein